MQDREAERHLLERPGRDLADEHPVGKPVHEPGDDDAIAVGLEVHAAVGERYEARDDPERRERARKPAPVPARRGGHDGDPRAHWATLAPAALGG